MGIPIAWSFHSILVAYVNAVLLLITFAAIAVAGHFFCLMYLRLSHPSAQDDRNIAIGAAVVAVLMLRAMAEWRVTRPDQPPTEP